LLRLLIITTIVKDCQCIRFREAVATISGFLPLIEAGKVFPVADL
jgi:hypothetical protein